MSFAVRVGLFLLPAALFAQSGPAPVKTDRNELIANAPDSSARATAVRASRAPIIDGRDVDEVWQTAPVMSDFREFSPKEGGPARYRTEFKAAFDDRNLYVFVRAFDPHPDSIMRALSRRDVRGPSDQLKLMIDSYFDRRNGYEFAVNPDGVKRDYAMYNDREEDESWDAVWDVGTRVDSAGWTAEFRIPFSQMRFSSAPTHTFGFAIWRDIERYKERTAWPLYLQSRNGLASQLGRLEGISAINMPRRLEVTPYFVAKNISRSFKPVAGPGVPSVDYERVQLGTLGADIKYGITPNISLDAAINPDFGQVESDPAVLNLSAFETFFQEKRPFFVEGTGLYNFGVNCNIVNCSGEGLFYSRRIGRQPQLLRNYGDAGSATATPILGAGKMTGRLPGGFSLGVLEAITKRVEGTLNRTIEPQTSYTVVRGQQEFRGGGTTAGFIMTGVNRSLDDWTRKSLRRAAMVGGLDFRHKLGGGIYELAGSLMKSGITGEASVIANTQLDAVHYYQQPDGGLTFDPALTSMEGDAEELHFGKLGGVVRFQTNYQRRSPGFDINDIGFLRRADQQSHATWFSVNFNNPTRFYRSFFMNFNAWNDWTTHGTPTEAGFNFNWHANLPNNFWVHLGSTASAIGPVVCDRCSRGGPMVRRSTFYSPWVGFNWDDRAKIAPYLFLNMGAGEQGHSWYMGYSPGLDFRPSTAIQVSVGVDASWSNDDTQWYGNFTDNAGSTHYTFAHLKQKTVAGNTRLSYTMSPTLTLQLYAQPFMTKGEYSAIRELSANPRAGDFDSRYLPYAPAAADSVPGFNFKQFRSNTVLRWEYRPASTLFIVWTHGREDFINDPGTNTWRKELDNLFALHPDNTFLIKVAYWMSR